MSPNWPHEYPSHLSCLWYIAAPPGQFIQLRLTDLKIEHHTHCVFDRLSIRAGNHHHFTLQISSPHFTLCAGKEFDSPEIKRLCEMVEGPDSPL